MHCRNFGLDTVLWILVEITQILYHGGTCSRSVNWAIKELIIILLILFMYMLMFTLTACFQNQF